MKSLLEVIDSLTFNDLVVSMELSGDRIFGNQLPDIKDIK